MKKEKSPKICNNCIERIKICNNCREMSVEEVIERIEKHTKEIMEKGPHACRAFLYEAGFITKKGKLRKQYRSE